jgi:hypothetical protein
MVPVASLVGAGRIILVNVLVDSGGIVQSSFLVGAGGIVVASFLSDVIDVSSDPSFARSIKCHPM